MAWGKGRQPQCREQDKTSASSIQERDKGVASGEVGQKGTGCTTVFIQGFSKNIPVCFY